MKRFYPLIIAMTLLATALNVPTLPALAAGTHTHYGEITPDNTYDDYPVAMEAGQVLTISLTCAPGSLLDPTVEVYSSAMVLLDWDDDTGAPCMNFRSSYLVFTAPATDTYIIRATSFDYAFGRTLSGRDGAYVLRLTGDFLPGQCDPVPVPEGSVVGTFVKDAIAHWAPGKQTEPPVVFVAGKSAWVVGLDESETFYQIAYTCDYLWVPVDSMGPNYDAVWGGAPLPTNAVK